MKTFNEAINESQVNIDGMKFTVNVYNDRNRGMIIQFIPVSKTLGNLREFADAIANELYKAIPEFKDVVWFESGNEAAGLNFRINTIGFGKMIEKALK